MTVRPHPQPTPSSLIPLPRRIPFNLVQGFLGELYEILPSTTERSGFCDVLLERSDSLQSLYGPLLSELTQLPDY